MSASTTSTSTDPITSGGGGYGGNNGNGGGSVSAGGPNGGISTPNSLYLITFAVTLSLLLSISCIILLRNVVLRARERRVRIAIAAGYIVPPEVAQQHGIRPDSSRLLGKRPVIWDVWMPQDEKNEASHYDWPKLRPVSVAPLPSPTSATTPAPDAPATREPQQTLFERMLHLPPLPRIPSAPAPAPPPVAVTPPSAVDVDQHRGIRVAVLIAMPPHQRRHRSDDEPLPEVVFGTSDIVWNRPPTTGKQ